MGTRQDKGYTIITTTTTTITSTTTTTTTTTSSTTTTVVPKPAYNKRKVENVFSCYLTR